MMILRSKRHFVKRQKRLEGLLDLLQQLVPAQLDRFLARDAKSAHHFSLLDLLQLMNKLLEVALAHRLMGRSLGVHMVHRPIEMTRQRFDRLLQLRFKVGCEHGFVRAFVNDRKNNKQMRAEETHFKMRERFVAALIGSPGDPCIDRGLTLRLACFAT